MFSEPVTAESKRRRWRFWLLIFGVPILIAGVGAGVWLERVTSELEAAIAETNRLDPRWRLADIEADRATPPSGQNGADKIVAIHKLKPAIWPDSTKYSLLSDLSPVNRLSAEHRTALSDQLAVVGPALAEARTLIDTPHGRHAITYTPDWISSNLSGIQHTREAAALLKFDVIDKADVGDFDGAVRSCHACLNAGASLGDEPNLIGQLVRVACHAVAVSMLERTLAQGEPSHGVLEAFQVRLEEVEPEPLLLYGLRGERAGGQQFFQYLRDSGKVPPVGASGAFGLAGGVGLPVNYLLVLPGYVSVQQAGHLRYMNEMVETAKLPPEQWAAALARQRRSVAGLPKLAQMIAPANDKVAGACQRNHDTLRYAIVAIAAERYRLRKGQWPATPDDLVKSGLLQSVPGDPYATGRPIKFARREDGWVVYTTGEDGKDDGGKLDKDPRKPGTDYGFRLWDVAARRQPPLPAKPDDQP
jgi:hypothetical protein